MLTNRKLSTGVLGLAVKMRVKPAGKDMVRSPVIFTRQLGGRENQWNTVNNHWYYWELSLQCRTHSASSASYIVEVIIVERFYYF